MGDPAKPQGPRTCHRQIQEGRTGEEVCKGHEAKDLRGWHFSDNLPSSLETGGGGGGFGGVGRIGGCGFGGGRGAIRCHFYLLLPGHRGEGGAERGGVSNAREGGQVAGGEEFGELPIHRASSK